MFFFRSIFRKSLKDYRLPVICWGVCLGLLMTGIILSASRAVIATYASIAPLVTFLGEPFAMQTAGGYVTFRYLETIFPALMSIWLILAGARLVRGEEERGTMEVLLAAPRARARLLLEKAGALLIATLVIVLEFTLGTVRGEALRGGSVLWASSLFAGLNLGAFAFFFGMLALLISQFTTSQRKAAGITGGLLILTLILAITEREIQGSWVGYLSPLYYYNLNRPLIASYPQHPLAALVLPCLALLCLGASLVLFVRRDIGQAAVRGPRAQSESFDRRLVRSLSRAERELASQSISTQTMAAQGWSAFWWIFCMVTFCVYVTILVPSIQPAFESIVHQTPWLQALFFDTPTSTATATLGTLLFSFVPGLVILLACTLALRWSADVEQGRLEILFSTPRSRARVLLENYCGTLLLVVLAPVLIWIAITLGALVLHLNMNQSLVIAASFTTLPPALITLGLVYVASGRVRYGAVVGIVSTYLAFSFLEETFEGFVAIPSWISWISIFHVYGNPIFFGIDWGKTLGMTAVGLILLAIGLLQFRKADVALG